MISFCGDGYGTCRPFMSSLNCCYQIKHCGDGYMHKELTYVEYRAVSASSKTLTPHPPLRPASVSSPKAGPGYTLAGRWGGWEVNILEDAWHRIGLLHYNLSTGTCLHCTVCRPLLWNLRIYAHHVVCEDGGGGTSCFPLLSVSMYSPTTFSYSSSWLFIQHLKPVLPALSARIAARSVRTCA